MRVSLCFGPGSPGSLHGKESGDAVENVVRQEWPWSPDMGSGFIPTMRNLSGYSLKV
jgi:hypothetical protein